MEASYTSCMTYVICGSAYASVLALILKMCLVLTDMTNVAAKILKNGKLVYANYMLKSFFPRHDLLRDTFLYLTLTTNNFVFPLAQPGSV
jgi:hypothetical protein